MPRMKRIAILAALAAALLAAAPAAHAAKAPRGFFGVMWDRAAQRGSADEQDAQWGLMRKNGVESTRVVFSWAAMQPTPGGVDDYSESDERVASAARHRLRLLPVVLYTPEWAKKFPGRNGSPPENPANYAAFMGRLVNRYGPDGTFWTEHPELPKRPIREWQIWNEPHFDFYWYTPNKDDWAAEYVNLLRQSKRAIRAVDPGAKIVLAAFADASWKVLNAAYRAGARGAFDVVAVNIFTGRPGFVMAAVRLNRRILRRNHQRRMPIWVTETSFPAAKGEVPRPEQEWQRRWYTTERGMARRLKELYALGKKNARRLLLQRIYWYTWASSYAGRDDLFDYSGLIRVAADGSATSQPALRAFRRSARR
ncbi:MAG TPA: hypothetical protein VH683_08040 [Thermoleophilaceae bacterium]